MRLKATILVEPIGKARARHTVKDGRVITYTPERTRMTQLAIQLLIRQEVMRHGVFGGDQPIRLVATFYRLRPKSLVKRVILPIMKPDVDNSYKLLADALEKFVYQNDSQITTALIKKRFGSPPRIELTLEEDVGE